ncbi:MAG: hypothetical protein SO314_08600 [Alphaproteobacteria bacterium]|nr:hypothetical protein [Alphaproteobacteria bacterium]
MTNRCSDECSRGSKNYSGSYATTTECGSTCRYCKDCTSGSRSYSGSYAGTSECGTCYYCSDNCRSGQKSVFCSSNYNKVRMSSTECGTGCYSCEYNSDCSVTDKDCNYGCAYRNSCGKCTSCKSAPPPPANPWKYVYKNCRSLMCWTCGHQQYCGSLYNNGYAPVYTCDNYCKNTSTGEYKFICSLGRYGIFSAKAATKEECNNNITSRGLTPPSGEMSNGSCDSSGSHSCSY